MINYTSTRTLDAFALETLTHAICCEQPLLLYWLRGLRDISAIQLISSIKEVRIDYVHVLSLYTDGLRTNVFVRFPSKTIACSAVFLAARQLSTALLQKPAWFLLFNVKPRDINYLLRAVGRSDTAAIIQK